MAIILFQPGGPPLTDASGIYWALTQTGQLTAGSVIDPDTAVVVQLANVNGTIWRQIANGNWSYTVTHGVWLPQGGTVTSPIVLPGTDQAALNQIIQMLGVLEFRQATMAAAVGDIITLLTTAPVRPKQIGIDVVDVVQTTQAVPE